MDHALQGTPLGVTSRPWTGRVEDRRLLTGTGTYVADLAPPGCLEVAFVRSPVAHAVLDGVVIDRARTLPGVRAVLTAADLGDVCDVPVTLGPTPPSFRPLATDRVRYRGEPVAIVLADDRYRADDAAARVDLALTPLPGIPTPAASLEGPPLYGDQENPGVGNTALEKEFGPPVEDGTWERAAVVVGASFRQQLLAPTSLEARAILVAPQDDRLHVWCSHQHPHGLKQGLAKALGVAAADVRVVVPDAGGAFGAKSPTFAEYLVVAHAARLLGVPVRWVEDRTEALHAATRGRGQDQRIRLAADADGKILAIDLQVDADIGAHPLGSGIPLQTGLQASGPYAVPEVHARVRAILTTTAPTFAYRGAGRPEAAYAIERGVDLLARELNIDPVELRRRNLITTFPYDTPTGRRYDSADHLAALDKALELLDLPRWRAEQARRRDDPQAWPLGVGLACYVERSGGEPGILVEYGSVEVRADGTVVARVGTSSTGQSHETVFAELVADVLGIDPARVRLVEADTDEVPEGNGSFASRSAQMGGAALHEAATALVEEARARAAERWTADLDAVTWREGCLEADGRAPLEVGELAPLRVEHRFTSPAAFPYGCYAAVVEVDPELGDVQVLRLVAVDDYGSVLDETVTRGQTLGSIVQGLGQALYEDVPLDADGAAVLPQGLLDYLLPTAAEVPPLALAETAVPAPDNPLGAKGAGEAGCIGVPPAIANAVVDALPGVDPAALQLPLTPETVWKAMQRPRERR
jgi:aerobic carbon-monoxide dehydrogenase large subunit